MFMSMPLVYVQACWKYSSSLCLSGFGIWWKRMNSLTRSIWRWYLAVPEYNLWMMADTFPKMLAYIRAGREARQVTDEAWRLRLLMQSTYQINHCCCLCVRVFSGKDLPEGLSCNGKPLNHNCVKMGGNKRTFRIQYLPIEWVWMVCISAFVL